MEGRIVTVCERALTTTVNDIEHTQSESYEGVAVIRVFFQPQGKVELAMAQITAVVQTILRVLPPGTFPPNILKYDASSVPIVQLGLSGQGLTEEDLYDLGLSFIRPRLANVEGASIPLPYGGKVRQVQVDVDPNLLYAKHLSATDISTALNQQNLILPAGVARIGDREFIVKLNSSPTLVSAMNDLPVRAANGAVVLMKDVAQVRLGYAPQENIVRKDGERSALLTVLKNGETSTLDIVKHVKAMLPLVKAGLPGGLSNTKHQISACELRVRMDASTHCAPICVRGGPGGCPRSESAFAKEAYGKTNGKKMGVQRQNRFHASAVGIIYEECCDRCPHSCFQESFSKRAWVRPADAHVLHQPRGTRTKCQAACRTAKSQGPPFRAH